MRMIRALMITVLLICLPVGGVWLAGKPVGQYTEFPPLTHYVEHTGFYWPAFVVLAAVIIFVSGAFVLRVRVASRVGLSSPRRHGPVALFPLWGWLGVALGAVAWALAWTRFEWFAPLQRFTFTPIWVAYIVVVNAMTVRMTGHCMLVDRTTFFLRLFPLSAVFWWFFEYQNRFVQNWYYEGVEGFSSLQYVLSATFSFATVLPAVMGTYELLKAYPAFSAGLDGFVKWDVKKPKRVAVVTLCMFGMGLAGIGVWPDYLFPLLWISPLMIMTSIQALEGRETLFAGVRSGRWRNLFLLAVASLICGFFWEMWNYLSYARWIYAVPFVGRFHVFEMPILGYAGYLPFGLECAVIAAFAEGRSDDRQ